VFFELKKRFDIQTVLVFALQLIFLMLVGCYDIKNKVKKNDIVNVRNGSGNAIGLMVDGQDVAGSVNDSAHISTNTAIDVGELSLSSQTNEVVGFANDSPPKYLSTPWTNSSDNFYLEFRPKIRIPVTVWIVKGPFAGQNGQRQHAIDARIRTSDIWRNEHMGVTFSSSFNIIDATGDPDASKYYAISLEDDPAGIDKSKVWKPLQNDIGFKSGQLNIYWVDTVNGEQDRGHSNFGAQIVMGMYTSNDLLAHEIGHAFSLQHIDEYVGSDLKFNPENIMYSSSESGRQFFTEGQLFRSHLELNSVLNVLYHKRPGELTRTCSHTTSATSDCPALQKRIWADGVLSAN